MAWINRVLLALLCLLGSAALGALWAAVSLLLGVPLGVGTPVVALAAVAFLAFNEVPPGRSRAALAVLMTGLTIAYANYTRAAGLLAGDLGLHLNEVWWRVGIELAWAVTRVQVQSLDLIGYAVGLVLAALLGAAAWRPASPKRRVRRARR